MKLALLDLPTTVEQPYDKQKYNCRTNGYLRRFARPSPGLLRPQEFLTGTCTQPKLSVAQYLQPDLRLYLVQPWPCIVCQQHFLLGLFAGRHLQLRHVFDIVLGTDMMAMSLWAPCARCDESSGGHDTSSTPSIDTTCLSWLHDPDEATPELRSMCLVCPVFVYPEPSVSGGAESVPNGSDGKATEPQGGG